MTETENAKLIDQILDSSNGYSWNFIKTTSTIVDFVNYLKNSNLENSIEYFHIKSTNEQEIDEVINWSLTQFDLNEAPIYTQDFILKLGQGLPMKSEYWLIFFKERVKTF